MRGPTDPKHPRSEVEWDLGLSGMFPSLGGPQFSFIWVGGAHSTPSIGGCPLNPRFLFIVGGAQSTPVIGGVPT